MRPLALFLICLSLLTVQVGAAPGNTIFDYAQELGLSQEQAKRIRETLDHHSKLSASTQTDLARAEGAFQRAAASNATVEQIKPLLENVRDCRIRLRFQDVETARKLEGLLSEEQRKGWQAIQKRETR